MLNFVKNAFRGFIELILWINLILFAVGGGIIGNMIKAGYNSDSHVALGVIIGLILGLFLDVIMGGFIANFLKLCENVEKIVDDKTNNSESIVLTQNFICSHKVRLLTNTDGLSVRKKPNPNIDPFQKISNGTEVQMIEIGENIEFNNLNAPWYKIRTKEGLIGWCFSGSLEKI